MMKVAGIDQDNDWQFGKGRASYKVKSELVAQNVKTRIKSYQNDWFLDTSAYIDWFTILGNKGNEQSILNEIRRVVLSTLGVATVQRLEIESVTERSAVIRLKYTDIYSQEFDESIDLL